MLKKIRNSYSIRIDCHKFRTHENNVKNYQNVDRVCTFTHTNRVEHNSWQLKRVSLQHHFSVIFSNSKRPPRHALQFYNKVV